MQLGTDDGFFSGLLRPRVLRPGLSQDRNVWVGVFPKRKELLIGGSCLSHITREYVGSAQLQMRQGADGVAENNATVIENLLKLSRGIRAFACGQVCLAADVH